MQVLLKLSDGFDYSPKLSCDVCLVGPAAAVATQKLDRRGKEYLGVVMRCRSHIVGCYKILPP